MRSAALVVLCYEYSDSVVGSILLYIVSGSFEPVQSVLLLLLYLSTGVP